MHHEVDQDGEKSACNADDDTGEHTNNRGRLAEPKCSEDWNVGIANAKPNHCAQEGTDHGSPEREPRSGPPKDKTDQHGCRVPSDSALEPLDAVVVTIGHSCTIFR